MWRSGWRVSGPCHRGKLPPRTFPPRRPRISSGVIDRVRAAANSIASGMPSRRWQIEATRSGSRVVVRDAAFAQQLHASLVRARDAGGRPLDPHEYAARPWRERVLDRVAFGLMRAALWVTGNRY